VGRAHRPGARHGRRKSPAWLQNAAQDLAHALPGASHRTLPGQTHIVKAKPLASVLADFFSRTPSSQSANTSDTA
jgi:hypothetical protein